MGRIVKAVQKICKEGFKSFLEDYLKIIVECFTKSKLQTFIYAFETALKIYGDDDQLKPYFVQILDIFIEQALQEL